MSYLYVLPIRVGGFRRSIQLIGFFSGVTTSTTKLNPIKPLLMLHDPDATRPELPGIAVKNTVRDSSYLLASQGNQPPVYTRAEGSDLYHFFFLLGSIV